MIWQKPKAAKKAISVICVAAVEARRLVEIVGNAGKYISIAKGPTADNRPRTMALRAKGDRFIRDSIFCSWRRRVRRVADEKSALAAQSGAGKRRDAGRGVRLTRRLIVQAPADYPPDGLAIGRRQIVPAGSARIELARTADFLARVFDHLLPLRDPSNGARDGEENGEHRGREAHRLQGDAGIEINIGIKLLFDEIIVVQRDALQLERDVEQRIVLDAKLVEHVMRRLLHDLGARIVILVDAMAKAHQAERIVLVFSLGDIFWNIVDRADFAEHFERRLIGAAMGGPPQAGDARCDTGERIGA